MPLFRKVSPIWRRRQRRLPVQRFGKLQPGQQMAPEPASLACCRSILALNTDDFCRNTSIHGLKYINSRKLHTTDRFFFGLALLAVLCCAAFLIHDAFVKWDTTPVIVGINPEPTDITNEPFPAVTICNLNQALASKAAQLSNNSSEYAMLQVLCRRKTKSLLVHGNNNWEQLISNISQQCNAMVIGCRFGAIDHHCERMFQPIVTDEGLCCVFNMLHPHFMYKHHVPLTLRNVSVAKGWQAINWHAELGYTQKNSSNNLYYPRASLGTGESLGLSLILDVEADAYYCSSCHSIGFKIALHSPNESPNVRETGVLLSPGLETKLRIEPSKLMTSQNLRRVHRKYRHCLFRGEGNLSYFAHYTQRNCEMECMSRLMLQHCNCIDYYMPRLSGNTSQQDTICSIRQAQCVDSVRLHTIAGNAVEFCLDNCLPSCFELNFNAIASAASISFSDFKAAKPHIVRNHSRTYVERNIAVVKLYYKEHTFRASKQTEFIGISDFLSNVGGLMGLFLGFSLLSIAECVYFALIRPCRICAQFRQHRPLSNLELAKATAVVAPTHTLMAAMPNKKAKVHVMQAQEAQWQRQRQQQHHLGHLSRTSIDNWFKAELGLQCSPA